MAKSFKRKSKDSISICINCYKITFKEKGKKKERNSKKIENVFGSTSIKPIMERFIKFIDSKKVFRNEKNNRILYLKRNLELNEKDNFWGGIIMKGHNGPETTIDEIIKNEVKKVSSISSEQFHCLPYISMLYFNTKKNEILFLAQSYRQFGFKDIFEQCFKAFVRTESEDVNLQQKVN